MEKEKLVHILNIITVLLLLGIYLFLFGKEFEIWKGGFMILLPLLWVVTLIFYAYAFREVKLNNQWFKSSFILNIISFIILIFTSYNLFNFLKKPIVGDEGAGWALLSILFIGIVIPLILTIISLVIFSIGFFRNKK